MLKGNDLILEIGGVRLAASKSCAVDRQTDTIEVCSPVDGAAKRFIPSTTSWSIQANGLYANASGAERLREIWRAYQNGVNTPLSVRYKTGEGVIEKGEAILTSLQETGAVNQLATFSIQLQGSGKLELWEGDPLPMTFEFGKQEAMMADGSGLLYLEDHGVEKMYSVSLTKPTKVMIIATPYAQVLIGDDHFAESVDRSDYQGASDYMDSYYKSRTETTLSAGLHYVLLAKESGEDWPKVNVIE